MILIWSRDMYCLNEENLTTKRGTLLRYFVKILNRASTD